MNIFHTSPYSLISYLHQLPTSLTYISYLHFLLTMEYQHSYSKEKYRNVFGYGMSTLKSTISTSSYIFLKAEVRRSFVTTTVREQRPRPHHKCATGRVRTASGDQRYPVLGHCQFVVVYPRVICFHNQGLFQLNLKLAVYVLSQKLSDPATGTRK